MKKFNEFSDVEKEKALIYFSDALINSIVCDDIVPECLEDCQELIDQALDEADRLQTPWFLGEILWEKIKNNSVAHASLLKAAKKFAEEAYYAEMQDTIVRL